MAKIFFDTEFLEDGITIAPISIGMVRGDGQKYYAEFEDAPWERIYNDAWIMENVFPHLSMDDLKSTDQIREEILKFVGPCPQFWAWFAAYDWVLLCQLFGRMVDLPSGWPKFCNDFRQTFGHTKPVKQESAKHNALNDALWLKEQYDGFQKLKTT